MVRFFKCCICYPSSKEGDNLFRTHGNKKGDDLLRTHGNKEGDDLLRTHGNKEGDDLLRTHGNKEVPVIIIMVTSVLKSIVSVPWMTVIPGFHCTCWIK